MATQTVVANHCYLVVQVILVARVCVSWGMVCSCMYMQASLMPLSRFWLICPTLSHCFSWTLSHGAKVNACLCATVVARQDTMQVLMDRAEAAFDPDACSAAGVTAAAGGALQAASNPPPLACDA